MAMSDEHKAALAQGRKEARAIKQYLEVLAARKPGRPVTPERLKERIADLEGRIAAEADPMRALEMRQARLDAEAALARPRQGTGRCGYGVARSRVHRLCEGIRRPQGPLVHGMAGAGRAGPGPRQGRHTSDPGVLSDTMRSAGP